MIKLSPTMQDDDVFQALENFFREAAGVFFPPGIFAKLGQLKKNEILALFSTLVMNGKARMSNINPTITQRIELYIQRRATPPRPPPPPQRKEKMNSNCNESPRNQSQRIAYNTIEDICTKAFKHLAISKPAVDEKLVPPSTKPTGKPAALQCNVEPVPPSTKPKTIAASIENIPSKPARKMSPAPSAQQQVSRAPMIQASAACMDKTTFPTIENIPSKPERKMSPAPSSQQQVSAASMNKSTFPTIGNIPSKDARKVPSRKVPSRKVPSRIHLERNCTFRRSYTSDAPKATKKTRMRRHQAKPLSATKTMMRANNKKKQKRRQSQSLSNSVMNQGDRVAVTLKNKKAVQLDKLFLFVNDITFEDVQARQLSCTDFASELKEAFEIMLRVIGPQAWQMTADRLTNKLVASLQVFGVTAIPCDDREPFVPELWRLFVLNFVTHIRKKFLALEIEGDKACFPVAARNIYKIPFKPWLADVRLGFAENLHTYHPVVKALEKLYSKTTTQISMVESGSIWFRPAGPNGVAWSDFEPVPVKGVISEYIYIYMIN